MLYALKKDAKGIPVAILHSCQDMKTIVLYLHEQEYSLLVNIRKKHLRDSTQAIIHPLATVLTTALRALFSIIAWESIVALILPSLCVLY